jgi:hypothetical protein
VDASCSTTAHTHRTDILACSRGLLIVDNQKASMVIRGRRQAALGKQTIGWRSCEILRTYYHGSSSEGRTMEKIVGTEVVGRRWYTISGVLEGLISSKGRDQWR